MKGKSIFKQLLSPMMAVICALAAALVVVILVIVTTSYEIFIPKIKMFPAFCQTRYHRLWTGHTVSIRHLPKIQVF